jgi:hypothetical protein
VVGCDGLESAYAQARAVDDAAAQVMSSPGYRDQDLWPQAPERIVHRSKIVRFRMLIIAARYEDSNERARQRSGRPAKQYWTGICDPLQRLGSDAVDASTPFNQESRMQDLRDTIVAKTGVADLRHLGLDLIGATFDGRRPCWPDGSG